MNMICKKKKGSVLAATMAAALLVTGISSIYGAPGVEPDRTCSLSFELDGQYKELEELIIPVDIYRVASIDVTGQYTTMEGYETLDFADIDDQTTAEEWEKLSNEAVSLAELMEPTVSLNIQKDEETGKAAGAAEGLETGMYLVKAQSVDAQENHYDFTPYLISLPNNHYYTTGDDSWVYDVVTGLKPEQTPLYGSLQINKILQTYNATLEGASFIFSVEAVRNGQSVYSNVVSLQFDAAGEKSLVIEGLPAGAEVTVTEVYTGASYTAVSEKEQRVTIPTGGAKEPAEVTFINDHDDRMNGGTSVVNHFTYEDGVWNWEQLTDNSGTTEQE